MREAGLAKPLKGLYKDSTVTDESASYVLCACF